jgi:hypothetical protein
LKKRSKKLLLMWVLQPLPLIFMASLLLTWVAASRPPEYDEAYSIFLTAGDPRPVWPEQKFTPADVQNRFAGHSSFVQIAQNLRAGDVHPPLYFWVLEIWRRVFGPSWFAARMLSVVISVASLAVLARIAKAAAGPVLAITLLSYGFAYTGILTRGFALAQFFVLLGVMLAYPKPRGLLAGLAFGVAEICNYLAVFPGLAVLLALRASDRLKCAAGMAVFLPAALWFFWAQKTTRATQFSPFSPGQAIFLLGRDFGAALFGGLPLYAGRLGPVVAAALAILFLVCLVYAVQRRSPKIWLFALCAAAMPLGLLALGLVFNNTPIEIRYLAFCCPFVALMFAHLPRPLLALLLMVEASGFAGLVLAPATMQPQGLAARQAAASHALVLVPFGNDGVGVPGPFIAAAPPDMRILLLRPGWEAQITAEPRIVLTLIKADDASRAEAGGAKTWFAARPCWVPSGHTALTVLFLNRCTDQEKNHGQ